MTKKQIEPIIGKQRKERTYIIHNWIGIDILIDYIKMQVSIIDRQWEKKQYMFCERWLSYEQWRYNILEAMQVAMKYWFDKLRERQELVEQETTDKLIALSLSQE